MSLSHYELSKELAYVRGQLYDSEKDRVRLMAENKRLREALESLLYRPHEQHCDWLDPGPDKCNCWLKIARDALEGKE